MGLPVSTKCLPARKAASQGRAFRSSGRSAKATSRSAARSKRGRCSASRSSTANDHITSRQYFKPHLAMWMQAGRFAHRLRSSDLTFACGLHNFYLIKEKSYLSPLVFTSWMSNPVRAAVRTPQHKSTAHHRAADHARPRRVAGARPARPWPAALYTPGSRGGRRLMTTTESGTPAAQQRC